MSGPAFPGPEAAIVLRLSGAFGEFHSFVHLGSVHALIVLRSCVSTQADRLHAPDVVIFVVGHRIRHASASKADFRSMIASLTERLAEKPNSRNSRSDDT